MFEHKDDRSLIPPWKFAGVKRQHVATEIPDEDTESVWQSLLTEDDIKLLAALHIATEIGEA